MEIGWGKKAEGDDAGGEGFVQREVGQVEGMAESGSIISYSYWTKAVEENIKESQFTWTLE